ncbi:sugar phosphate isomerase/epimerase family protein [Curtobacterium sp. MCPF17_002]|uniref:sugar phosphate isomerase/epimerase family protein n=1 Tax=Curtobacterium sp. MCPF17_002 TaxID=2175645 RepID=UPI000DA980AA|nr:sugar phosphate isomerase/epimerase family protein [Curtobacterium sp. MCPF17_002]WIB77933.1 sugar phosphate isomerase/epimerase family protein [Curtobacterium sp. MCPF17_002]
MNRLTVQEQHVPGASLEEQADVARSWGFDGLELRSAGDLGFAARLPALRRAAAAGVYMPTTCVEMSHFIGAFDADLRADAVAQMRSQLSVMAEIGGVGVMTPASYGMFSRRLPPFEPPRSPEDDRAVLVDALGQLGEHAVSEGVTLFLEPLNRYEDHMVNRLADAASLIREVGSDGVRIVADTYHMNIEEADPAQALLDVADLVGHVQASDSNRLEPGAGHVDWALFGATVQAIGYTGSIAIESRLSGLAADVLPTVPPLLRRYL